MPVSLKHYKGHTIALYHDQDGGDSRSWDNLGEMVCNRGLGDHQVNSGIEGAYYALAQCGWEEPSSYSDKWWGSNKEHFEYLIGELDKVAIWLYLYVYEHSGITMNTTGFSCPWDSSTAGLIFCPKTKARNEYGWKKLTKARIEKVEEYLKGEVETYDKELCGEIYGRAVFEGELEDECDLLDSIESCWGFYGQESAIEDAKQFIDNCIKKTA